MCDDSALFRLLNLEFLSKNAEDWSELMCVVLENLENLDYRSCKSYARHYRYIIVNFSTERWIYLTAIKFIPPIVFHPYHRFPSIHLLLLALQLFK